MYNISFNLHNRGIVNKFLKWEVVYQIAKLNNLGIMLNWTELDYIELPNTVKGDILQSPGPMGVFYSKELEPEFKLDNKDWICACGMDYTDKFNEINAQNRTLSLLKFKNLDSLIRSISSEDCIGIHAKKGCDKNWFIKNIKDNIAKNPEAKFYLSTNGDFNDVEEIFNCSPKIIDFSYFSNTKDENYNKIIDLCALSHCKLILGSLGSSFSRFPFYYRNVPVLVENP